MLLPYCRAYQQAATSVIHCNHFFLSHSAWKPKCQEWKTLWNNLLTIKKSGPCCHIILDAVPAKAAPAASDSGRWKLNGVSSWVIIMTHTSSVFLFFCVVDSDTFKIFCHKRANSSVFFVSIILCLPSLKTPLSVRYITRAADTFFSKYQPSSLLS